ncbi:hypothetical protein SAMN05421594_4350 [Chryseobacterium oleae]|uniref:Uncharacterized protein n=1 Tax=Chryseobacterium oleae TaxID=491207 RepID=A0A1I5C7C3_CHROL|nr:hypothetical protein SAMN05421594_4350 [Chryseobacterium oleae]
MLKLFEFCGSQGDKGGRLKNGKWKSLLVCNLEERMEEGSLKIEELLVYPLTKRLFQFVSSLYSKLPTNNQQLATNNILTIIPAISLHNFHPPASLFHLLKNPYLCKKYQQWE